MGSVGAFKLIYSGSVGAFQGLFNGFPRSRSGYLKMFQIWISKAYRSGYLKMCQIWISKDVPDLDI